RPGTANWGSGLQTGGSWCQAGNCVVIRGKFCEAWHLEMSFCRPDPQSASGSYPHDGAAELQLVAGLHAHAARIARDDGDGAAAAQQERRVAARLVEQQVAAQLRIELQ